MSTTKQGASGLGLEAQRAAIAGECERRGWDLLRIEQDVHSGKTAKPKRRPGLGRVLQICDSGEADVLVVAKLDRLSRSLKDFADLVERSRTKLINGTRTKTWEIVALDMNIDTTTPYGKALVGMAAVFAELESALVSARTQEACAMRKARGERLGAKRQIPPKLRARMRRMRSRGMTYAGIAAKLNEELVLTPRRKRWHAASVRAAVLA